MNTVGILVDASVFRNIKSGKTGTERLSLYNKAAKNHGLIPVYLCLDKISPDSGKTYGYQYVNGKYVYKRVSIPKVIHNRALPPSRKMRKRLARLARSYYIFNARNRYSKYRIHQLLKDRFASHLPVTVPYSKGNLERMMNRFNSLFLKPVNSSVGKGIVKVIRKSDGSWKIRSPVKSDTVSLRRVAKKVNARMIRKGYLIQETIPLAKYKGKPYDIRVSVQRGFDGDWHVTGMFAKVAGKGRYVTNVARGGSAKKVKPLLEHNFSNSAQVADHVKQISLDITRFLGSRLKNLADVGLDIGVDASGKPYFIELNGRDQRYGFKKAKMQRAFYRSYETPILYAKYLLRKGNS